MIENTEILVDTNILVYAIDTTEKDKHEVAKKILTEGFKKSQKLCFSTQNLSEFFVVSTATIDKPINKEIALNIIKRISYGNVFYSN